MTFWPILMSTWPCWPVGLTSSLVFTVSVTALLNVSFRARVMGETDGQTDSQQRRLMLPLWWRMGSIRWLMHVIKTVSSAVKKPFWRMWHGNMLNGAASAVSMRAAGDRSWLEWVSRVTDAQSSNTAVITPSQSRRPTTITSLRIYVIWRNRRHAAQFRIESRTQLETRRSERRLF